MKQVCYYAIILFALCASCSKGTHQASTQTASVDYGLINEVEQLNGQPANKLAYRLLNSQEKTVLWQRQLGYYLEADLNADQKKFLKQFRDIITPQLLDENATLEVRASMRPFEEQAKQLFDKPLLANIFSNIHTERSVVEWVKNGHNSATSNSSSGGAVVKVADSGSGCDCNYIDDFCHGSGNWCKGGSAPLCNVSSSGCGWLFVEECNGYCILDKEITNPSGN